RVVPPIDRDLLGMPLVQEAPTHSRHGAFAPLWFKPVKNGGRKVYFDVILVLSFRHRAEETVYADDFAVGV
ncbi:MAG: hypothetical protein L3J05_05520, partial [Robiginitomaculum sp.]|nr:hypothetical protein [Robiginitomaculum sp.]